MKRTKKPTIEIFHKTMNFNTRKAALCQKERENDRAALKGNKKKTK